MKTKSYTSVLPLCFRIRAGPEVSTKLSSTENGLIPRDFTVCHICLIHMHDKSDILFRTLSKFSICCSVKPAVYFHDDF